LTRPSYYLQATLLFLPDNHPNLKAFITRKNSPGFAALLLSKYFILEFLFIQKTSSRKTALFCSQPEKKSFFSTFENKDLKSIPTFYSQCLYSKGLSIYQSL
jgi:hypothetical protein